MRRQKVINETAGNNSVSPFHFRYISNGGHGLPCWSLTGIVRFGSSAHRKFAFRNRIFHNFKFGQNVLKTIDTHFFFFFFL